MEGGAASCQLSHNFCKVFTYVLVLALEYCVHIWILCILAACSKHIVPQGLVNHVPPGAVGGLYGSGCLHLSSNASTSCRSIYRLISQFLIHRPSRVKREYRLSHTLLSRLGYVPVDIEQGPNVARLAPPQMSMDCPIEGELEATSIQSADSSRY